MIDPPNNPDRMCSICGKKPKDRVDEMFMSLVGFSYSSNADLQFRVCFKCKNKYDMKLPHTCLFCRFYDREREDRDQSYCEYHRIVIRYTWKCNKFEQDY